MKLQEMTASIKPAFRRIAEKLLNSEDFESLKDFGDGFEAFIGVEGGVLLPEVVLNPDGEVLKFECQCRGSRNHKICVHIEAVLLGIEKMLQAGCDDYHEAVMKLAHETGDK